MEQGNVVRDSPYDDPDVCRSGKLVEKVEDFQAVCGTQLPGCD